MSESNARKEMAPVRRTADELSVVTRSQPQTVAVGRALGECLAEGDVLVLTGDLGAGKTQLTKGMAAGLGITEDVTSPTFTIEMVYEGGRLPLYHFDLYRLDDPDQLEDTGLFDVLGADGVCSIDTGVVFLDVLNNAERISDHCSNIAVRMVGMEAGEDYDSHTLKSIMHHNPSKDYMLEYEQCRKEYLVPLEEMEA